MLNELIDDLVREHPSGPIWNDERDLLFARSVASETDDADQLDLLWTCGHIGARVATLAKGSSEGIRHELLSGSAARPVPADLVCATGLHAQGAALLVPQIVLDAINEWYTKLLGAIYWASCDFKRACASALMAGADLTMAGATVTA
jgi:hypothetical protein